MCWKLSTLRLFPCPAISQLVPTDPETPHGSPLFSPSTVHWVTWTGGILRALSFAQWGAGHQGRICHRCAESALFPIETSITSPMNWSVYTSQLRWAGQSFVYWLNTILPQAQLQLPRQQTESWTHLFSRTSVVGFWQCPCALLCDVRGKLPTTQRKEAFFQICTCLQQTYSLAKGGKGKAAHSRKGQSPWYDLIAGNDEYPWI